MNIQSVTVSVGCDDYLAATLPHNKTLFDRSLVVTSPEDKDTQRVCQFFNVECLITDAFTRNGDVFNKGRAINEALEHLDFREWAVHLDADVVLPPLARQILERIQLNEQFIYGVDRVMCPSPLYWKRFLEKPLPQHDQAYVHVGPFPVGTRVMKLEDGYGGWVPLGYFQMFHRQSTYLGKPFYPTDYDTAANSDLYFAKRWPRPYRQLLPEIIAIHLATDDLTNAVQMGGNWNGRRSARFEVPDPFLSNNNRPKCVTPV